VRGLQQRPEQPGEPHGAKEFQRKTVEPNRVRQFQKCARTCRTRVVDEHIATAKSLVHAVEQLLACRERAQIAGHRDRLRPLCRDDLGRGRQILL
jgi:hypothetical protein